MAHAHVRPGGPEAADLRQGRCASRRTRRLTFATRRRETTASAPVLRERRVHAGPVAQLVVDLDGHVVLVNQRSLACSP